MGQWDRSWVIGHAGQQIWMVKVGHGFSTCDPLTHDPLADD